jgi:hypothetical protein
MLNSCAKTVFNMKSYILQPVADLFAFGEPIPNEAECAAEREALHARISTGPIRFDDVKRLNTLDDLDGDWGCRPLRVLLYKLSKKGD